MTPYGHSEAQLEGRYYPAPPTDVYALCRWLDDLWNEGLSPARDIRQRHEKER